MLFFRLLICPLSVPAHRSDLPKGLQQTARLLRTTRRVQVRNVGRDTDENVCKCPANVPVAARGSKST